MPKSAFYIREIKLIHIAKKQLGLDEDSYRDILKAYGGHDSSTRMTSQQRNNVLKRLKALGFQPQAKATPDGRITTRQKWRLEKACKAKGWRGLDDPAARAFIKRTAKVASWQFLTTKAASRVITGLEKWQT